MRQRAVERSTPRARASRRLACAVLLVGLVAAAPGGAEEPEVFDPAELVLDEAPVVSIDTGFGPIEYRAGRGVHFGDTGLNIGGFATVEFQQDEGDAGEVAFDSLNFLILYQPNEHFRAFAEIEVGGLVALALDGEGWSSDPDSTVERLFADLIFDDPLALRVGKFQTPVGRWNLVPAEPFVWTAEEPVMIEVAFDEHQSGGALLGALHPAGGTLNYWLYGQFFGPLDKGDSPEPADHSVGGRLEFGRELEGWSVGASYLASERRDDWSHLGGLDAQWRRGPFEITTEALVQSGSIEDRDLWDVYVQGVFELCRGFYLVGRYEHFDPFGSDNDVNLGDVGFAWIPRPYLHFKATYRLSDEQTDDVSRGIKATISVIF